MALYLAAAACVKQNLETPMVESEQTTKEQMCSFEVKVPQNQTKLASPSANEETVNNLQVFIFDEAGNVDNFVKGAGPSLNVKCTKGKREIYVIANVAELGPVGNKTGLMNKLSNFNDNTATNFVMTGNKIVSVDAGLKSVSVEVERIPSRICLKSFANEITLHPYSTQELVINAAYLVNVAKDATYFLPEKSSNLAFLNFKQLNDQSPLLYEKINDVKVSSTTPFVAPHYFYCYPNSTSVDCTDNNSVARYTRLVVEATLGGKKCYYVASIPQIKRNTTYEVSMHVTRPGSLTPDAPLEKHDPQFSVTVKKWVAGAAVDEII